MKRMHARSDRHRYLAMGLVLLLMLLAACGTNVAGTTTGSNGPAAKATGGTATMPGAQHCGTVHTMRLLIVPTDQSRAKGIEDCFWQAYQQCRAAMLSYSQAGVDTADIHNFSLKSQNGTCAITDAVQHEVLPRPAQPVATYTCTGLTQQRDGLHFAACGSEGNVVVPIGGIE